MYDPFTLGYAGWVFNMFNIPLTMMPRIVDSAGDHFGSTKQGTQSTQYHFSEKVMFSKVFLDPPSPSRPSWQTSLPQCSGQVISSPLMHSWLISI